MKTAKLLIAAGFTLATSVAVAETGVGTFQIDNVTNVYGRAGAPTLVVKGVVRTGAVDVTEAGRGTPNLEGKGILVTKDSGNSFGRS